MLKSYKGRELKNGQRVMVYFNLHTHLFSVKDAETGLVLAHGNDILLNDIEFKVSEAGRQRVLREKKKNVHAYVVGAFAGCGEVDTTEWAKPYYNPYKVDSFVVGDRKVTKGSTAWLSNKVVYAENVH